MKYLKVDGERLKLLQSMVKSELEKCENVLETYRKFNDIFGSSKAWDSEVFKHNTLIDILNELNEMEDANK